MLYSFGKDDHDEIGLCAECFMELLISEDYEITKKYASYLMECPNCHQIFEVSESVVGKPPFTVICPNCNMYVDERYINEIYEEGGE